MYAGQTNLGSPGSQPYAIAFDSRSSEMFVTEDPSYVSVLSGSPPTVVDSISLGTNTYPEGIAYDGANNTVFVGTSPNDVAVISGSTDSVVARVNVGFGAMTLAYDPGTGSVYASGGYATNCACGQMGDNNVTVINGTTYDVSVLNWSGEYPFSPSSIVIDPATNYVVAMGPLGTGGDSVAGFNATTGKLVWEDTAGTQAPFYFGLTANSQTGALYLSSFCVCISAITVLNGSDGSSLGQVLLGAEGGPALAYDSASGDLLVGEIDGDVQALNTSSSELVATLPVGGIPAAIGVNASSGVADVVDGDTSAVAEIASNASAVLGVSNAGGGPNAIAFDNQTGAVYVASSDNVSVVNTTTHRVVGSIAVGANPEGILYDPASNEVFVANMWSNTVSVISGATNDVEATVPVDSTPYGLAWNNATNQVYVTCMNFTGSRALIDVISGSTLQVTATISLGQTYPDGIAFVPSLDEIFVDNAVAYYPPSNLTVLSATTYQTLANITLPSAAAPGQIVYDDSTGDLYIAGAGYFVDGPYPNDIVVNPLNRSVVATIPVGSEPEGMVSDPGTAELFALSENNDTVSVIGGTTDNISSTVTLPSGTFPDGIAYDPASHQVLVSDWGTDSVSYIVYQVVYPVTFTETGLPSGLNWSVTVNGTPWPSNSSTLSFPEPNGTYSYSIASADQQYQSRPVTGNFTVAGAALAQSVGFQLVVYSVTFTESGLPAAGGWYANVTGQLSVYSTTTTASIELPNGTYTFAIGTSDKTYSASGGSFTAHGGPVSVSVAFSRVTYSVTVTESGLPSGTTWTVMIDGTPMSGTGSLAFELPNGTYAWKITSLPNGNSAIPGEGTLTVQGGPTSVAVTISPSGPANHLGPAAWAPTPLWVWILIGVIIIAAVAAVVIAIFRHKPQGPESP
jgi:YVTN family beta-propeller protein